NWRAITQVGRGFHMGSIRYDNSGLGGEALEVIAVGFYRSGDSAKAIELRASVLRTHGVALRWGRRYVSVSSSATLLRSDAGKVLSMGMLMTRWVRPSYRKY